MNSQTKYSKAIFLLTVFIFLITCSNFRAEALLWGRTYTPFEKECIFVSWPAGAAHSAVSAFNLPLLIPPIILIPFFGEHSLVPILIPFGLVEMTATGAAYLVGIPFLLFKKGFYDYPKKKFKKVFKFSDKPLFPKKRSKKEVKKAQQKQIIKTVNNNNSKSILRYKDKNDLPTNTDNSSSAIRKDIAFKILCRHQVLSANSGRSIVQQLTLHEMNENKFSVLKSLVALGLDLHAKGNNGYSSLEYAREVNIHSRERVLAILEKSKEPNVSTLIQEGHYYEAYDILTEAEALSL